jgi:hypothetical protein
MPKGFRNLAGEGDQDAEGPMSFTTYALMK